MKLSRHVVVLSRRIAFCFAGVLTVTSVTGSLHAQRSLPSAANGFTAVHLIGLPEVKTKAKGSISFPSGALAFTSPGGNASIARATMLRATVGDERMEPGGTAGRISRAIIPFGGGLALAAATNKQVSLLTIEFRDEHDALHGAVFVLPKEEALQAQQQLNLPDVPTKVQPQQPACNAGGVVHANAIRVASIETPGEPVPAEYRVLLYEQLLLRLREQGTFAAIYRDGDDTPGAACAEYSFTLTLTGFKKGNAALRASTGPVGFFVGATSLTFHDRVQDANGSDLIDDDFKVSERGDTESLNVADKVARSLTAKLKKASGRSKRS